MWRFGVVVLLLASTLSHGQEKLSQHDYKQLKKAFDLIEASQTQAAKQQLLSASDKVTSPYAKALVWQNLGQLELRAERHRTALKYLQKAHVLEALPATQQSNLLKTIAQLHCMAEQWSACSTKLNRWIKSAGKQVRGDDHLLLAQAYSQQEKWRAVLPSIRAAIATRKVAPRSWYQLETGAQIRLKRWAAAAKAQQRLVRIYPKRSADWRQLTALQLQAGQNKAALATQRMGFESGLLTQGKDYRQLAQMLLRQGAPYKAGEVLESGLKRGSLKGTARELTLLSQSWQLAKEKHKAIAALTQLQKVTPSAKNLARIAQLQIDLEQWRSAQRTLSAALKSAKGDDRASLQLLLGITQVKLEQFVLARNALKAAADFPSVSGSAKSWLRYLEQVAPNEQLAVAG
ncbi:hypothetical protein [Neptunomonas sp. XY-337]|uniref:tetratricopeptide repeat protein n=1 Tax=Neptunomonas sp. XY-337 TaxID=2561897 RepID=UPI0010AA68A3|nr:hypothetical protein [Neptunomonas sp. XY-337]